MDFNELKGEGSTDNNYPRDKFNLFNAGISFSGETSYIMGKVVIILEKHKDDIENHMTRSIILPVTAWQSLSKLSLYLNCVLKQIAGHAYLVKIHRIINMELEVTRRFLGIIPYPSSITEIPICSSHSVAVGENYLETIIPLIKKHATGQTTLTFKCK